MQLHAGELRVEPKRNRKEPLFGSVVSQIVTHEQPIVRHAEGGFKKEFALDMEALQVGRGGWMETNHKPVLFSTQEYEA